MSDEERQRRRSDASVSLPRDPEHDLERAREREDDVDDVEDAEAEEHAAPAARSLVERLMISPADIFR